ncbi:MAG: ABC transporter ATP-binding protein [Balneolales bacterium]|nr:ABC transporter ATP-binding protein [Balneolales bacterium]
MLHINSINFGFPVLNLGLFKKPLLFENLSVNIEQNKVYGLFGLNGAGKTTLLNLMAGLLFPKSGSCVFKGVSLQERAPSSLDDLFFVPDQFDLMAVRGNDFLNQYAPFYSRFSREEFDRIAGLFDLSLEEKLTHLSYGQKKKFLIAFAFATGASLLLLDEPTNGLDIPSKSQFRKVLASADLVNRSVIISTHQVRDLAQSIDHTLILDKGNIVLDSSISTLSESLAFKTLPDSHPDLTKCIYSEQVLGGYKAITTKNGHADMSDPVDLELLFNAAINEQVKLNEAILEVQV